MEHMAYAPDRYIKLTHDLLPKTNFGGVSKEIT